MLASGDAGEPRACGDIDSSAFNLDKPAVLSFASGWMLSPVAARPDVVSGIGLDLLGVELGGSSCLEFKKAESLSSGRAKTRLCVLKVG